MKCNCTDWKENIDKVEAPRRFYSARNPGSFNYDSKVFVYCPWCAQRLIDETTEEKQK